MNQYYVLLLCMAIGFAMRRSGKFGEAAPEALNAVIVHVCLPALILLTVRNLRLTHELIAPALVSWLVFGAAFIFFLVLGRVLKLDRATVGTLILTAGIGSTSFVGIPLTRVFFGDLSVPVSVLIAQAGSCLLLPTIGVATAALFAGHTRPNAAQIGRSIVTFTPTVALFAAVILIPFDYPAWLNQGLETLGSGSLMGVLTFMSVGAHISTSDFKSNRRALAGGIGFKLLLAPALIALFLIGGMDAAATQSAIAVSIFQSAMPTNITASVIARNHQLNARLARAMVSGSLLVSIVSLPLLSVGLHAT